MTTLAQRARSAHRRAAVTAGAETVTFRRGTQSVTVAGAIGNEVVYDIVGREGMTTQVTGRQWLLPQDQVILGGSRVEPKLNDQIVTSAARIYEPMKPGPDLPEVTSHCGDEFWLVNSKRVVE